MGPQVSIRARIYKKLHPKMTWGSLDPMCHLRVKLKSLGTPSKWEIPQYPIAVKGKSTVIILNWLHKNIFLNILSYGINYPLFSEPEPEVWNSILGCTSGMEFGMACMLPVLSLMINGQN